MLKRQGWLALSALLALGAVATAAGVAGPENMDDALVDQNLDIAENRAYAWLPERLANRFTSGFISAFLLIIVSEIGDKTFFIAAVLAMKRGALVVFCGASAALAVMTVLSALAGKALPGLVDPHWTHLASIAVFVIFGVKLLWEGHNMPSSAPAAQDEIIEEVSREIELREGGTIDAVHDLERGGVYINAGASDGAGAAPHWSDRAMKFALKRVPAPVKKAGRNLRRLTRPSSSAFTEAFVMTFAAEWGDRSQIATLALGASKDIYGVNLGAVIGHMACTLTAVSGGRVLADKLSEKSITLAGGSLFLAFALAGYFLEI